MHFEDKEMQDRIASFLQLFDKKIETKFEGGDENYNTSVGAFDKTVNSNTLSAMEKCMIDGFEENYAIVSGKFAVK